MWIICSFRFYFVLTGVQFCSPLQIDERAFCSGMYFVVVKHNLLMLDFFQYSFNAGQLIATFFDV
jgi:hypothetical protein